MLARFKFANGFRDLPRKGSLRSAALDRYGSMMCTRFDERLASVYVYAFSLVFSWCKGVIPGIATMRHRHVRLENAGSIVAWGAAPAGGGGLR